MTVQMLGEKKRVKTLTTVLIYEFWLLFDAVLGVGLHGAEINV